jgi:hypothetical protein
VCYRREEIEGQGSNMLTIDDVFVSRGYKLISIFQLLDGVGDLYRHNRLALAARLLTFVL